MIPKSRWDTRGAFQKGYINYSPVSGFQFIVRRNARSIKVDFSVPLPDFKHHWTNLLGDDRFFPGHSTVSSFLKSATSLQTPPLTQLWICQTSSLPMYTHSLQSPWSLQPRPTSLDRIVQRGEMRSHQPWGLREDIQEPPSRPKKGLQDTKGNTLNVRLISEKRQRR